MKIPNKIYSIFLLLRVIFAENYFELYFSDFNGVVDSTIVNRFTNANSLTMACSNKNVYPFD